MYLLIKYYIILYDFNISHKITFFFIANLYNDKQLIFILCQYLQFIYFFNIDWSHILYYSSIIRALNCSLFFYHNVRVRKCSWKFWFAILLSLYLFSLEFMTKLYIFCSDKCTFYLYTSWITTKLYAHKNMNTILLSMYYTWIFKIHTYL